MQWQKQQCNMFLSIIGLHSQQDFGVVGKKMEVAAAGFRERLGGLQNFSKTLA